MATGIYKRGKVWWVRYTGLDGKQKRESSNSEDFKVAKLLLAERYKTIEQGQEPEVKRIPNYLFKELADKYIDWIKGRQRSAKIKGYIIGQLKTLYADIPLKRFNTAMVDQLQTDLINKNYKPASNNKITNILKHMLSKAVEWEMVDADVLKRIRKVKPLRDDNRRLRYLSNDDIQGLLKHCHGHLLPIVITALNTGMRRGEILSLKWENVDMVHGFIHLEQTKNGDRRDIPINDTLKSTLKALTRRLDSPYVFYANKTGKPYRDVKKAFQNALTKAKIQDFHFHDLRHTFASHCVMAGIDITTVSRLLGHKSLTMTLRYSHLAPSHMVNAVNILDATINGKTVSTKIAQSGR